MSISNSEMLQSFDPNSPAEAGKLFGLPYGVEQSEIIIIPVPWEVTVSYREGTAFGPDSILAASSQVEVYSLEVEGAWKLGVCFDDEESGLKEKSKKYRELAKSHIRFLENRSESTVNNNALNDINRACQEMVDYVHQRSIHYLDQSKIVGIVGGDHSTPLGLIKALAEKHQAFGVLQIDAHADLRYNYENFKYSHGSIMYNALELESIKKVVQVGIRDLGEEEKGIIDSAKDRVKVFFYPDIKEKEFRGVCFKDQVKDIISELPDYVYISFDIDGLEPSLCPNTGTPVPGGLSFEESRFLIKEVVRSGRKIIGFDLCEVAPAQNKNDDWDSIVGSRVLKFLIDYTGVSQELLRFSSD